MFILYMVWRERLSVFCFFRFLAEVRAQMSLFCFLNCPAEELMVCRLHGMKRTTLFPVYSAALPRCALRCLFFRFST